MSRYGLGDEIGFRDLGRWRVVGRPDPDITAGQVEWYEIAPLDGQSCTLAAMSVAPDGVVTVLRWGATGA